MKKKKTEAVLVRKRGGKLVEMKLLPHGRQASTNFATDDLISGSMETKSLEKYHNLIEWLEQSGRLKEVEEMILAIFS